MPAADQAAVSGPRVVDPAPQRIRHPRDVLSVVLCLLGIVAVLVLATYAHGTTEGLADDVQGFSALLARILVIPVVVLESLLVLVVPAAVGIDLAVRKLWFVLLSAALASVTALALAIASVWAIEHFGAEEMVVGLSVWSGGRYVLTIPAYVASVVALLVVAGPANRRKSVRWSWNLLWFSLVVVLITGQVSIPGVLLVLLLGRLVASGVRWALGSASERAHGMKLVAALQGIGIEPVMLARVGDVSTDDIVTTQAEIAGVESAAATWSKRSSATRAAREAAAAFVARAVTDPASRAIARSNTNRVYALLAADSPRMDLVVLDGDRQVVGFLGRLWQSIRLRGFEGRSEVSLRAVAERTALLSYSASNAGVRTPRMIGIAAAEDSMLLVQEHASGTRPLRDLTAEEVSDAVLAELWRQISVAHQARIVHRGLSPDVVLVSATPDARTATDGPSLVDGPGLADGPVSGHTAEKPEVWLTGWESGDIAASDLTIHLDLAQMLALVALKVGADRAIASATAARVPLDQVGPFLQAAAMPRDIREGLQQDKKLLAALRNGVVTAEPGADIEPQPLRRFSLRTVVMPVLTVVAIVVVVTTVNFDEMRDAVLGANPWWALAAFGLGALGWIGSTITLQAFSSVRLPFRDVLEVQVAASFVAIAAPAGIGPATLNLRMLTKRGMATSLAVATVTLVQVSQFLVTLILLAVLSVVSGDSGVLRTLPSGTVLAVLGVVLVVAAVVLAVPALRNWLVDRIRPTLRTIWPPLSEALGAPERLALGVLGSVILTMSNVLALMASLAAFGQTTPLIIAAVVYLVGNTVGAAVPTPGGLGAIEFALVTGLTATAQVPSTIATSAVILFRTMTYWARIPIGWLTMRNLQRRGDM